ncbi:hypothetical protein HYH03_008206 [Edaphochlamys debaryana]|uniref:U-box domain-containing protein n=1 Tax=Edaphochlamys debaryana TaxID=47281 RepID=A0A836BZ85_9CHLO|nr:hypothetical protein HYH03_008206 [Edaphochlamys debaryana]|eukprot:KAG2493692.1 hypothetical protein HYH03_008206 [Edaphochlamys debaryana]
MAAPAGCIQAISELADAIGDLALSDVSTVERAKLSTCFGDVAALTGTLSGALSSVPGLRAGVKLWCALREIESTLVAVLQALQEATGKGPTVLWLQADLLVARFNTASARLAAALGQLEEEQSSAANSRRASYDAAGAYAGGGAGAGQAEDEAAALEALRCIRRRLQHQRFALEPGHAESLERFRHAAAGMQALFGDLSGAASCMLRATQGEPGPRLTKPAFSAVVNELSAEAELLSLAAAQCSAAAGPGPLSPQAVRAVRRSGGGAGTLALEPLESTARARQAEAAERCEQEALALRLMMDVVRAQHVDPDAEAPLEFVCPLTHTVMHDPVILHETGHSYERPALINWWNKGNHFCPRSGQHLKRLSYTPNHSLRAAIERWRLHSDMQLTFRPVLDSLAAEQRRAPPAPTSTAAPSERPPPLLLPQQREAFAQAQLASLSLLSLDSAPRSQPQPPQPAPHQRHSQQPQTGHGGGLLGGGPSAADAGWRQSSWSHPLVCSAGGVGGGGLQPPLSELALLDARRAISCGNGESGTATSSVALQARALPGPMHEGPALMGLAPYGLAGAAAVGVAAEEAGFECSASGGSVSSSTSGVADTAGGLSSAVSMGSGSELEPCLREGAKRRGVFGAPAALGAAAVGPVAVGGR